MTRCLICNTSYDPAIGHKETDCRVACVDVALAKQLQASIERNARMVARLKKLQATFADGESETVQQMAAILKDEEPTW